MIKAYCIDNRDEFNADGNRALGTLLKFLRDRSERIDPFALAAQLESFNQSKETLMSVLACAAVRLEAAERQNAVLREAVDRTYCDALIADGENVTINTIELRKRCATALALAPSEASQPTRRPVTHQKDPNEA